MQCDVSFAGENWKFDWVKSWMLRDSSFEGENLVFDWVKSWTLRDLSFMGENLVAPLCLKSRCLSELPLSVVLTNPEP